MLPSTLIPTTWAISTTACSISDPPNCSQLRGNLFSFSQSTSWKDQKTWSLSVENAFGWNPKDSGDFGFDDLTLASPAGAVGVHGSVIASLTNVTDSYTGLLGLAARNVTLSENTPSLLAIMRNANQIPSLSYSYTAGAEYSKLEPLRFRILVDRSRQDSRSSHTGRLRCIQLQPEWCVLRVWPNGRQLSHRRTGDN